MVQNVVLAKPPGHALVKPDLSKPAIITSPVQPGEVGILAAPDAGEGML